MSDATDPVLAPPWVAGCPSENDLAELSQGLASPAVREQVITHLDGCPRCSALLAELAEIMVPSAPRRIGRYEVLEPIGSGGMGVVFLARDPGLRRQVALKLLRADLLDAGDDSLRERLLREARLLAALTHPNVVAVHDVGEVEGDVFIAMEYVAGRPVSAWLGEDRPAWSQIVSAFAQAGRGLAAAHALGIVHRDVKPSNLLVGADGRVRLTDFGLATTSPLPTSAAEAPTVVSGAPEEAPLTQAGVVLGTPAYMAPEQRAGRVAGPQADQFAFCLCLYEALTGVRPSYAGESWQEAPRRDAMTGVPDSTRDAVLRGLSLSPEVRFPDMAALLGAFDPTPAPSAVQPAGSRWGLALVAGAVILAGVLVAGALLWRETPAPTATRRVVNHAGQADARAASAVSATETAAEPARASPSDSIGSQPSARPTSLSSTETAHRRTAAPRRNRLSAMTRHPAASAPPRAKPRPHPSALTAFLQHAMSEEGKRHARAAQLLNEAVRAYGRRQGKRCLERFGQADKLAPTSRRLDRVRAVCLMLAGRCRAGERMLRAWHRREGWKRSQGDVDARNTLRFNCPGGAPRPHP